MKKFFLLQFLIIALLSKAQWSELGGFNSLGANDIINSVCNDTSGHIYAAGLFKNDSGNVYVAKWDGSSWSELGGINSFNSLGWNGGEINCLCTDKFGNVYAATKSRFVAKWNGISWSILSINTFNGNIYTLTCDPLGNVYAAGEFQNINNKKYVAKWDGTSWSELGGTNTTYILFNDSPIYSICSDLSGAIYVTAGFGFPNQGHQHYVAKWDGNSWIALGVLSYFNNDPIYSLCTDPAGNIYAGGFFVRNGFRYVAKFDGASWSDLGGVSALSAIGGIASVCIDIYGNVYATSSGDFTTNRKYYVTKFNGSSWSELGGTNSLAANYEIKSICTDKLGNIYAAGSFTNSNLKRYVARYSGNVIPLSLLSFYLSNNKLYWRTAQEQNTSHFIVERSSNGKDFEDIGSLPAFGYTQTEKEYSFNVNNSKKRINYYRLKMVDKDGKFNYSKIIRANLNNNIDAAEISPNPVKSSAVIKLQSENKESVQIQIINCKGEVLLTKVCKITIGDNVIALNTQSLVKGTYFVLVNGANTNESLTLIKQ